MRYPPPVVLGTDMGRTNIGWPGHPYHVELAAYSELYMSVRPFGGYRHLNSGHRGFIATPRSSRRAARILRRYLKIAWKWNQHPRKTSTAAMVQTITENIA